MNEFLSVDCEKMAGNALIFGVSKYKRVYLFFNKHSNKEGKMLISLLENLNHHLSNKC